MWRSRLLICSVFCAEDFIYCSVCCSEWCVLCGVRDSIICACVAGSGVLYVEFETHLNTACVALNISCVQCVLQCVLQCVAVSGVCYAEFVTHLFVTCAALKPLYMSRSLW